MRRLALSLPTTLALALTLAACSDSTTAPSSSSPQGPRVGQPELSAGTPMLCQPPYCVVNPGRILFSDTTGMTDLYSVNPDGTGLKLEQYQSYDGAWTPTYDRYVMASQSIDVLPDIWLSASTTGSPGWRLTSSGAVDQEPAVSPDGKTVAFASDRVWNVANGGWELFVEPINRQWLEQGIAQVTFSPGHDRWPHWAPDGTYLVYSSQRLSVGGGAGTTYHVWRMYANGTNAMPLNLSIEARYPVVSPDGKHIAFATRVRDGSSRIGIMNPDGTNPIVLYNGLTDATQPTWSRDGKRIAFASNDPAWKGIDVMNADGTNVVHVASFGGRPKWAR
jgi:TolB protein